MEDNKSDLLQYAREYATANKDLYELLSVAPDAAQPEVHRAWRKASLKHHPDKAKNFDPETWQLFERARDVLSLPEARAAYDSARAAAVKAQQARAALDATKRAMIDDLEARERGVKRKAEGRGERTMMTDAEKRALAERTTERLEKRRRMKEEAEARERERMGDVSKREPEPRPMHFNSTTIPTSASNGAANADISHAEPPADEYDDRIADLERKLRERRAEKAARKAEKKNKSGNRVRRSENDDNRGGDGEATTAQTNTTTTTNTPPPIAKPIPQSIPMATTQQAQKTSNAGLGGTSSLMEKLRAAQREKERKMAETVAAAAATTVTTSPDG
ncbi:hypothetical protein F5B22DRAFT_152972 [Xylaria bambusicola]|uniref:uncharacterized protein n=1 Tax=Xylaria bambusicola TaxID=326684 RepID=UPI0020075FCC|nr:uncharacterized protein F5B22DRAFT_152972 [Xylaria bambusicola]KAI0526319.1 hypothetical protein F5B22DRAFT_152972 [Xylaria bambusicola]